MLREGFRKLSPDVVTFQESVVTDDYDQVADILGPEYHVVHQGGRSADGAGASIASVWPIERVDELALPATPRMDPAEPWIGSVAVAHVSGTPLMVVNHKPAWQFGFERERELQAVATARFVEELVGRREDVHVILSGDFDATPESASMRFWRGMQSLDGLSVSYHDSWDEVEQRSAGHTFTPANPLVRAGSMGYVGRRIDYVMVRCDARGPTLEAAACFLAFDKPVDGVWASDHFGVVADLVTH